VGRTVALQGGGSEVARTVADLMIGLSVAAMANILRRRTLLRLLSARPSCASSPSAASSPGCSTGAASSRRRSAA
jgi:hypothetical protein